jgi:hypothetical protein
MTKNSTIPQTKTNRSSLTSTLDSTQSMESLATPALTQSKKKCTVAVKTQMASRMCKPQKSKVMLLRKKTKLRIKRRKRS